MSFCSRCGDKLDEGQQFCPKCGFNPNAPGPQPGPPVPKPESRIAAVALLVVVLLGVGLYALVAKRDALSRLAGLTQRADTRITLEAQTSRLPQGETWDASKEQATVRVLTKRLDDMGYPAKITSSGRTFVVELPRGDQSEVVNKLTKWGHLEFRYFKDVKSKRHPTAPYVMDVEVRDDGSEKYTFTDDNGKDVPAAKVLAASSIVLTGDDLKPNANAEQNSQNYQVYVAIEFTENGRKVFAEFTRRHVGDYLAIILDGRIISTPTIDDAILDGKAIIRGGFKDIDEAKTLADLLRAGTLPAPLDIVKVERI